MVIKIAESASVSSDAELMNGVSVWDFAQVRENAAIGENSIIGSYAYIDVNVQIGAKCKIQNRALIYDAAIIHNGVFIGPGAILTNDKNPRSVLGSGDLKIARDWKKVGVEVLDGASIGSGAICVAPIRIGKWALVGAGAVVTRDVKDYALVVGNPARQIGWVGEAGQQLETVDGQHFKCPVFGTEFELINDSLVQN